MSSTLFPILAIVFLGYTTAKVRFVLDRDVDAISKITFSLAIPMLLFISAVKAEIPSPIDWKFLLAFYSAIFLMFILGILISRYRFRYSNCEQAVYGVEVSYANVTIVGIPICHQALGTESLLPLIMLISIHNVFIFSLGILVAERQGFKPTQTLEHLRRVVLQLLKSPITVSLLLGLTLNLSGIQLYTPLQNAIELMAQAAIPMALFALGASLNRYHISGSWEPLIYVIFLKNFLMPLLVWLLAFHVFDIDRLWATTAVLASAMPVAISTYIFAKSYQTREAEAASSLLLSTLVSIASIPAVIFAIGINNGV